MPFAQMHGELCVILIPFPGFGDIGNDGFKIIRIAHEIDMADGEEIRGARFRRVGKRVEGAAILANAVIGNEDKRLLRQALRQRRERAIAGDLAIQRFAFRVGGEGHLAACGGFKFRFIELLRPCAGRDALHIRNGDRRAGGVSACGQQHQCCAR